MNMGSNNDHQNADLAARQRLRWTDELHQQFVDAVNQLGGAEKATPKGVLRIMSVPSLTIYHIKSHLQKYRLAKYLPEPSADGTSNEKDSGNLLSAFETSSGMQLSEALKLQMEVQKRLHEQLEVQRQLQLRIEAQGRYLKKIIEEQQRLSGVLGENLATDISSMTSVEHNPDPRNADDAAPGPTTSEPQTETETVADQRKNKRRNEATTESSLLSSREPRTPDSSCRAGSPVEQHERRASKRPNAGGNTSSDSRYREGDLVLPHIFESSSLSYSGH